MKRVVLVACMAGALASEAPGRDRPATEEQVRREASIMEFTERMKAANYPALFEKAAEEFNVPADILKGVAFAETRWEHLTWPEGETVSPDNGMPRPYGIMSLWDNDHFGRSLIEAAALIKQPPEVLKKDAFQNIRGAAALLRKHYEETPRADASETGIESWRYAIRKYCGIPEPDLNAQHALDVFEFIHRGFNQFGIEWKGRSVDLERIRAETAQIVAEERAKLAGTGGQGGGPTVAVNDGKVNGSAAIPADSEPTVENGAPLQRGKPPLFLWVLLILAVLAGGAWAMLRSKRL